MNNPAILGGLSVRSKPFKNRKTMRAKERKAAIEVINSDVLSGFLGAGGPFFLGGDKVKYFEKMWAKKYGFKYAISVNSWTSGLIVAVGAIGIEPGDEVICSPYSMSASATCALFYGGIPIFADINPNTFCLDPESIKAKISNRTKAIIIVHLFGHPANMDEIREIAKSKEIKIIEDAAQAPGVLYKGQPVGTLGCIGGFSLNFHKHIHTGEGGVLVTNDHKLALRCQLIRNHGENAIEEYGLEDVSNVMGGNYRLTEISAAIGIEQLKRLDKILDHRQQLADYLNKRLNEIDGLTIQKVPDGSTHAYYVYPIKYDESVIGLPRNLFVKAVQAELPKPTGWETTPLSEGYVKPLYLNPIYQKNIAIGKRGFPFNYNRVEYEYPKGLCPVTERMYEKELLISSIVREPLNRNDMKDFVDAIEKVIENASLIRDAFKHEQITDMYNSTRAVNETDLR